MRRTKKISIEQYPSHRPFNRVEEIKKLVNQEAFIACRIEGEEFTKPPEIPAFEKPPKVPLSAGMYNFIKSGIMAFLP